MAEKGLTDDDRQRIYDDFNGVVNMAPKELESWLDTEKSRSVGDSGGDSGSGGGGGGGGESTGHRSGRRIVEIKRTNKADLSDADYRHMNKVVGYCRRHLAQRPDGDITDTDWRYSLMNWGHDPKKDG